MTDDGFELSLVPPGHIAGGRRLHPSSPSLSTITNRQSCQRVSSACVVPADRSHLFVRRPA